MATVTLRPNETFESLMRRFKKTVERAGILADYREHEVFEKPSVKKKHKQIAARKRALKKARRLENFPRKSNENFRFSKDRTEKIYAAPQKNRSDFKKKFVNTPNQDNRPAYKPNQDNRPVNKPSTYSNRPSYKPNDNNRPLLKPNNK